VPPFHCLPCTQEFGSTLTIKTGKGAERNGGKTIIAQRKNRMEQSTLAMSPGFLAMATFKGRNARYEQTQSQGPCTKGSQPPAFNAPSA
jgi:hypothetical protein